MRWKLEEKKIFGTLPLLFVRNLRDVRKVASRKGRSRVFQKQGARLLVAKLLAYGFIGGLQTQRAAFGIVRVASDKVHVALPDPAQRVLFRAWTEGSRQRAGRDPHKAAERYPFRDALPLAA